MIEPTTEHGEAISTELIADICQRFEQNKKIRQPLPGGGVLHIDRLLPFICVYRRDPSRMDKGIERFVVCEASYILLPGMAKERPGLRELINQIGRTATRLLEAFLVLEVWSDDDEVDTVTTDTLTGESLLPAPGFRILSRRPISPNGTVSALEFALQKVRLHRQKAQVQIERNVANHPPNMQELISEADEYQYGCHVLGLAIKPLFRDAKSGETFDPVLRSLCRQVSRAIKKSVFQFALTRTNTRPEHHFSMGSSKLTAQVMAVDRQLAEVSSQFKFLLLVTPINAERAWHEFAESGYRRTPNFQYRPQSTDPLLLKRKLLKISTDRVEDPTLAYVFHQTQWELDRQITMLNDIGTPNFLLGSMQVFGRVPEPLRALAIELLQQSSTQSNDQPTSDDLIDAQQFAELATAEIAHYQQHSGTFLAKAIVQEDMYSGLLASGGNLLIGREMRISARRADALLQHEVGTHLVTYHNGSHQPLRLLKVGLAGYDALQEGFAVLAEYLVGGLNVARLRTLAVRVIATDELTRGTSFPDVFARLVEEFKLEPKAAYTIVMRVFRGGGLTKDALYLQGLVEILQYVGKGGDLQPLLVGKLAANHIPVVRELIFRGMLKPPTLRPRFLDFPDAQERLASITATSSVLNLVLA